MPDALYSRNDGAGARDGASTLDFSWFFSALAFAVAMGAARGPSNTMLAASGATVSAARCRICSASRSAFPAMFLVVAYLGNSLLADPVVHGVMIWPGTACLPWLAFAIATA